MASGPALALLLSILAVGLALVAWGVIAVAQWLRLWRRGRRESTAPRDGVAALEGTCRPTDPESVRRASLSGREALWYEVSLQRDEGRPVRPQWTDVGREGESVPFDLDRDAWSVRVFPADAAVDLAPAATLDFDANPDALASLGADLASIDVEAAGGTLRIGDWDLEAGEHYRLVERRLEPGAVVSVTGRVERTPGANGDRPAARIAGSASPGLVGRFLGVPFVVADASGYSGPNRLRNRGLVGLVFGLPLTLLAIVFLFPPGT